MKSSEKRGLLVLIGVVIIVIGIIWLITNNKKTKNNVVEAPKNGEVSVGEFTETDSEGTVVNTSEKLKENKEIEGFKITSIRFEEKDGQSTLIANVTNTSGEAKEGFLVDIVLYDKAGNEIGRIPGNIIETIAGETIEMRAGITESYVNAYDFKLEKK